MIKRIRSLDIIPKLIIFFGVVGTAWFAGVEAWFRRPIFGGGYSVNWGYVFFTTFLATFFSYWLLFGLRKKANPHQE